MQKIFEKILEMLEDFKEWEDDSGRPIHTFSEVQRISKCKEIVQEVAKEYNNGWIPCSDRLPKEDGTYLVQSVFEEEVHFYDQYYDSGCEAFGTYSDYYDKNTLGFLDSEFVKDEDVVAWQPLPEPYQPEGE